MIRLQKTREASILADIFLTKSRYSLLIMIILLYQNYQCYVINCVFTCMKLISKEASLVVKCVLMFEELVLHQDE